MKKQKQLTLNISELSSSDDEQAKPKIDKEELKKYIKDSDDESTQESSQKLKAKKKKLTRLNSTTFSNKAISQKISEKNLLPETELRKLRRKAKSLGGDNLNYSGRKNYKYVVEYNDNKIHFGSPKTDDYINHQDKKLREKYLNRVKKIKNKDGELTYKLPTSSNYWAVKLLN